VDLRPIPLLHFNPKTGFEGKFSMAFNLALGALKGWPEIEDYSSERTQDPAVRAIMARVRNVPDPADGSVNLAIITKGGKRFEKNVKHAPGDPTFGLQEERNLAKFRACAACRLASDDISTLEKNLLNLESVADVSTLMPLVSARRKQQRATAAA
jgi:2-methylcitrate dehydratase PrpD